MEKLIKKLTKKTFKEAPEINNRKWIKLSMYLFKEMKNNDAREFRLVLDDSCEAFYIHPLGKSGKTLDGNLFIEDNETM